MSSCWRESSLRLHFAAHASLPRPSKHHPLVTIVLCVFATVPAVSRSGGNFLSVPLFQSQSCGWGGCKVRKQMRLLETHCLTAWLSHLCAAAHACMLQTVGMCVCGQHML